MELVTAHLSEENVRRLVGITGDYEDGFVLLSEEVVWIGRAVAGTPSTSTHLLFEDQSVSRVHGAFAWVGEYQSFAFHHRSQTNPTFINDKVVTEPILLKPGDRITFGHQKLRFEFCESQSEQSPSLTPAESSSEAPSTPAPPDDDETNTLIDDSDALPGWEVQPTDSESQEKSIEPESGDSPLPSILSISIQGSDANSETLEESGPSLAAQPTLNPQVEPLPESEVPTPTESVELHPLNIGFKIRGKDFRAGANSRVSARFSPKHEAVNGPVSFGDGDVYFEIPARLESEVQFELLSETEGLNLKVEGSRTTTKRTTSTEHLTLEVLIQESGQLPLHTDDRVSHQGADFWYISPTGEDGQSESAPTLEMDPNAFEALKSKAHRGMLEFQTGDWKGATITILPTPDSSLDIGPGCKIGPYSLPLEDCPTCRISYDQLNPQVEVLEAADGQYVSINGELLFACQANPLVSGSGLFLGKYMLHWTQPELQSMLSQYRLKFEGNSLPISRGKVRIGTASHCEILIDGQGLSPVTGTLECTLDGFLYHHLDSAIHAQVNGEIVIKGESAVVKTDAVMQLGMGSELILEKRR